LTDTPKARSVIDWEKVERDYRAGIMSLREIGEANGCSHVAVSKRAKAEAWPRDLKAKIQAKADALVNMAQVNAGVNAARESETVEAGAALIASVRLGHRQDIVRARSLAMKLLGELEVQTDSGDLLEQLEAAVSADGSDGASKVFQRVISTSGRIDSAKKIAEAMKVLITMEREAYGIVEPSKLELTNPDGSLEQKPTLIQLIAPSIAQ